MKTFIAILASLFIFCNSCLAFSLSWNANPPAESVTQYNIYRVRNNVGELVGSTPLTTFNVDAYLGGNRTKFYITAVNVIGEGLRSSTVTVQRH